MRGRYLLWASTLLLASFGDTTPEEEEREVVSEPSTSLKRPALCRRYYNNGNHERWSACMGVGYRNGEVLDD